MYVAANGGEEAIQQAERLYHDLKGKLTPEMVEQVEKGMPYLLDRIMGESSLYAPQLAALALAQAGGDTYEAVLILRAYRSTQPRLAYALPIDSNSMTVVRRISAAFKDIPGGQILGPTLDYSHRLLRLDVLDKELVAEDSGTAELQAADEPSPKQYPPVTDWQRTQKMLPELDSIENPEPADLPDLTREPIMFPTSRPHRLQALARADTGGLLALGYANMRGFGPVHPTVNEVRLSYARVQLKHPVTGTVFSVGNIRVSHAEVVQTTKASKDKVGLELGFCATFGWNEVKNIAGSMLDLAMDREDVHPAFTEEFVLYHTESVESSGFCIHLKLPHYVTFTSGMDAMKDAMMGVGMAQMPTSSKAFEKQDAKSPAPEADLETDEKVSPITAVESESETESEKEMS